MSLQNLIKKTDKNEDEMKTVSDVQDKTISPEYLMIKNVTGSLSDKGTEHQMEIFIHTRG